ncbi:MAG: hypothetical protein QGG05_19020, partial [Candidatus Latescibacteria bacterium]|nr:hypothetical protein [Candidatus Latescibacterota bacterium]
SLHPTSYRPFTSMPLRQKLLVLYAHSPDLKSRVVSWATYDGTGRSSPGSGDEDKPPYGSVVAAMEDGWRVIQFPQQSMAHPGMEYHTSYLRYEYILEQLEEID